MRRAEVRHSGETWPLERGQWGVVSIFRVTYVTPTHLLLSLDVMYALSGAKENEV